VARGIEALEIASDSRVRPHVLTAFARLDGTTITYPVVPDTAHVVKELNEYSS
jgi:hypothetical protein